jgi:hypothetical protein
MIVALEDWMILPSCTHHVKRWYLNGLKIKAYDLVNRHSEYGGVNDLGVLNLCIITMNITQTDGQIVDEHLRPLRNCDNFAQRR